MQEGSVMQVAYIVRDLDAAMKRHWEVCGMGPWDIYTFEAPKVRDYMYRGRFAAGRSMTSISRQRERGCITSSSSTRTAPRPWRTMGDAGTPLPRVAHSTRMSTSVRP